MSAALAGRKRSPRRDAFPDNARARARRRLPAGCYEAEWEELGLCDEDDGDDLLFLVSTRFRRPGAAGNIRCSVNSLV